MPASYFLDSFGCAKNQVDSEGMMARLDGHGWTCADDAESADLIIVNSCGFIEDAKRESINAVLEWKKNYPEKKILLAGCLAQRYSEDLASSLPEADGILRLDDAAEIARAAGRLVGRAHDSAAPDSPPGARPLLSMPGCAYVKISEGCNHACSFCAIPLIRGSLRCRGAREIVDECRDLIERGVRELCIIGQDICAYKDAGLDLPGLLREISKLRGDFWVRLLYMHPDNFPLGILDVMENDPRILPYFDIPLQHASRKILKAMRRSGDAEKYLALAGAIRARIPGAIFRTTFLLGFPGETEEDFQELLRFQQELRPHWLGCFAYSREEGTAAYDLKNKPPKKIAQERKRKAEEAQMPITEEKIDELIGRAFDVLLEEKIDGDEGEFWLGRLFCHAPEVDGCAVVSSGARGDEKPGEILRCETFARRGFDIEARFLR
ncbi:MAG: 30S ribosomal protein S12 methylthiotransferase RimO [Treponema sp.]|nr:30S ribosomal protein S12 methylthiotransferase RimO [Treponema sp.]